MYIYGTIVHRIPIEKGWSGDRKFGAVTSDERTYLLRISSPDQLERKRQEFTQMSKVARLEIPMCRPVEFGVCEEGVYSIQSWINDVDAETAVMTLEEQAQYRYGIDAGRILAKIYTLPAPQDVPKWETQFNAKIDRKLAMYNACTLKYPGGETFIRFIEENRHKLKDRPQSYQHGNYHIGNMMIDETNVLNIIDFDRNDFGNPWEEFNRIVWCAQTAPAFASGMVDGYFDGPTPQDFWDLLALYIATNTLSSLPWSIPFGEGEIQVMQSQAAQVLTWYNSMSQTIPTWYHKK